MTANEKRGAVSRKYSEILGRNKYSQDLRNYCFKMYKDGKYYSDCSSSVSYAYREAGYDFGILNTVGMYQSTKMVDVPVTIKAGKILNPEVLRVGDMLLFAGSDKGRQYAGFVGHVEMVYSISGSKVTLCGHGSGTPRTIEMNSYLNTRYSRKTNTSLGHSGLIRVRRFIVDDITEDTPTTTAATTAPSLTRILKKGCKGEDVREMQKGLIALGYSCGSYGSDGDFGSATLKAVKAFQKDCGIEVDGEFGPISLHEMEMRLNRGEDA